MILYILPFLPSSRGGGSPQRYWNILKGLNKIGPVHMSVTQPGEHIFKYTAEELTDLSQYVTSVSFAAAPEWRQAKGFRSPFQKIKSGWIDLFKRQLFEIPSFSRDTVFNVASQVPKVDFDLVFTARLSSFQLAHAMMRSGLIKSERIVCDFDDILSDARKRDLATPGYIEGHQARMLYKLSAERIRRVEDNVVAHCQAISVCSDQDVTILRKRYSLDKFYNLPNVVSRPRLPQRSSDDHCRLLFVGNLSYGPNVQGLRSFLINTLPLLRISHPKLKMRVVGINPGTDVIAICHSAGVELYPNAPTLDVHYQESDIVIVPINLGGGTRVKIVEAMAYGRPVVSTSIGAEGLNLVSGENIMLADTSQDFAAAIASLMRDSELRVKLVENAYNTQLTRFSNEALDGALRTFTGKPQGSQNSATVLTGAAYNVA
jgi:polysaccharide biosynthesis protein PslH